MRSGGSGIKPLTRDMGLDTIRKRSAMLQIWADSSVGRALPLQGRGHRFNPCSAYQAHTFDTVLPKLLPI